MLFMIYKSKRTTRPTDTCMPGLCEAMCEVQGGAGCGCAQPRKAERGGHNGGCFKMFMSQNAVPILQGYGYFDHLFF